MWHAGNVSFPSALQSKVKSKIKCTIAFRFLSILLSLLQITSITSKSSSFCLLIYVMFYLYMTKKIACGLQIAIQHFLTLQTTY